mgnify:CR=1 FL=1
MKMEANDTLKIEKREGEGTDARVLSILCWPNPIKAV